MCLNFWFTALEMQLPHYVKSTLIHIVLKYNQFCVYLQASAGGFNSAARGQMPIRQRMKKVTLRDLHFLFENEKDLCKSPLLYKSYLK